jgi:hypothetical protein
MAAIIHTLKQKQWKTKETNVVNVVVRENHQKDI